MDISLNSIKGDKAMSAYMTEFTSFNVIDADRLDEIKKSVEMVDKSAESGNGDVESGNGGIESKTELEPQPIPINLVIP